MRREEELAQRYLVSLRLGQVIYEPEPNLPPDFLIDGTVAVEVRRLNQNEITESGDRRGLEETHIPFTMRFKKLLSSLGPPRNGMSWFVTYRIQRPLTPWEGLRPMVKECLLTFLENPLAEPIQVDDNLEIGFYTASNPHPTAFVLGGGSDGDSGGSVVHEMLKNLRLCVAEKTLRIAPHRYKYSTWWLLLVDYIGHGLGEYDQQMLIEHWDVEHDWDKIIIVSPLKPCSRIRIEADDSPALIFCRAPLEPPPFCTQRHLRLSPIKNTTSKS